MLLYPWQFSLIHFLFKRYSCFSFLSIVPPLCEPYGLYMLCYRLPRTFQGPDSIQATALIHEESPSLSLSLSLSNGFHNHRHSMVQPKLFPLLCTLSLHSHSFISSLPFPLLLIPSFILPIYDFVPIPLCVFYSLASIPFSLYTHFSYFLRNSRTK